MQLTVAQLVKKFAIFNGTQNFIHVFTTVTSKTREVHSLTFALLNQF